ncbi:MAG TPA: DNA polymerase/3'-5' exonuclease PolX [Chloroflexota bacterium]|nr:DNA polymerase/3'-5' exonuclease PolX [Chloroflexota bacterium]
MRNDQVAAVLNEIGDLLEIKGENRFRVNAYRDAARQIDNLGEALAVVVQEGRLRSISGVGEAIAAKIQELVETGQLAYFERLKRELPVSLLELLQIPGLGPRKVKLLYDQLQVTSLADLQHAMAENRVAGLPGMGGKTVLNLQREIERLELRGRRVPLGIALPLVEEIVATLRSLGALVDRVDSAGSVRRRRDTIGDLDVLAASENPPAVLDAFVQLPVVQEVIGRGDTKASILTHRQLQVDLRVVAPEAWGSALLYFTGSKAHNVRVREIAVRKGWRLNEYGLFDERDGKRLAGATEEDVYHQLGMTWITPELREDSGEIEAALANQLPHLVEIGDVRGDLHSHSTWSDGTASIEAMWQAARERKYEFLALTDHSHSLGVTSGLTVERLREQRSVVDAINRRGNGPRLLHGIELEIRADGTLDFPDDVLSELDIVIASVHSAFGQSREKMTARLVGAARNPHVDIIGHPSGRLLGRREPYDVDLDALIDVCAETGVALEINANPARLDLDDIHARHALERGAWLAINTDAHQPENFDLLPYGIATARRGWIPPERVLNCHSLAALLDHLRARSPRVLY